MYVLGCCLICLSLGFGWEYFVVCWLDVFCMWFILRIAAGGLIFWVYECLALGLACGFVGSVCWLVVYFVWLLCWILV